MSCEHSLLLQPTISFPNSRIRDFYTPFPKSKPLHDKTGLRLQMAFRGTSSKLIEYVGKVSLEHITDQNYLRNVRAFCEKMEKDASISPTNSDVQ
jgi:hypothetical protein